MALRVRWVTWWPAPYWRDRFNQLSQCAGIDLEVIFLAAQSALQQWQNDCAHWTFKYRFATKKRTRSGYYNVIPSIPDPKPILNGEFDCLIMPYADMSCLASAFICKIKNKPYILFSANTRWDKRVNSHFRKWIKYAAFRNAAGILATGIAQYDYAIECGAPPNKVFVIGNPAVQHKSQFKNDSEKRRLRNIHDLQQKVVVLYVGRLGKEKGLDALLKAVSFFRRDEVHLILAGAGPQEASLRKLAVQLEINPTFTGFVEESRLSEYYALADIFVLPSMSESWGLVVNEAMEFRLPVILSDHVGSAPMLLREGVNGFSVKAGNVEALVKAMHLLVENPDLRREMGKKSKEIISQHSISSWRNSVLTALSKVAGRSSFAITN